ncbi:MAG: hypothetical protein FWE05_04635 [Defluviitaleaceae bacterium]|nr:hypothetical protein [Defluviitaleaceae bacterium]
MKRFLIKTIIISMVALLFTPSPGSHLIAPQAFDLESYSEGELFVVAHDLITNTTTAYCMITNKPLEDFEMYNFSTFHEHGWSPMNEALHPRLAWLFAMEDLMTYLGVMDIDELLHALYSRDYPLPERFNELVDMLVGPPIP